MTSDSGKARRGRTPTQSDPVNTKRQRTANPESEGDLSRRGQHDPSFSIDTDAIRSQRYGPHRTSSASSSRAISGIEGEAQEVPSMTDGIDVDTIFTQRWPAISKAIEKSSPLLARDKLHRGMRKNEFLSDLRKRLAEQRGRTEMSEKVVHQSIDQLSAEKTGSSAGKIRTHVDTILGDDSIWNEVAVYLWGPEDDTCPVSGRELNARKREFVDEIMALTRLTVSSTDDDVRRAITEVMMETRLGCKVRSGKRERAKIPVRRTPPNVPILSTNRTFIRECIKESWLTILKLDPSAQDLSGGSIYGRQHRLLGKVEDALRQSNGFMAAGTTLTKQEVVDTILRIVEADATIPWKHAIRYRYSSEDAEELITFLRDAAKIWEQTGNHPPGWGLQKLGRKRWRDKIMQRRSEYLEGDPKMSRAELLNLCKRRTTRWSAVLQRPDGTRLERDHCGDSDDDEESDEDGASADA